MTLSRHQRKSLFGRWCSLWNGPEPKLKTNIDEFKVSCLSTRHCSQVRPDSCEPLRSGYKGAYRGVTSLGLARIEGILGEVEETFLPCSTVRPTERHDGTPVLRGLPVGAIAQCPGNRGSEERNSHGVRCYYYAETLWSIWSD